MSDPFLLYSWKSPGGLGAAGYNSKFAGAGGQITIRGGVGGSNSSKVFAGAGGGFATITDTSKAQIQTSTSKAHNISLKKDDRVKTPLGLGKVWSVETDLICVILDNDTSILYEFDSSEVEKANPV